MPWLLLALAIACEVTATTALKLSDGFTHLGWTALTALGYITSFTLLSHALKLQLDMGTAYAVWAGAGTALIALIGAAFMGETLTPLKIGGILLIIGGVVLLNLAAATP